MSGNRRQQRPAKLIVDSARTIKDIKQITIDVKVEDVVRNDYVAAANNFDKAKVKAAADAYALPDAYKAVDVEALRKRV